MFSITRLLWFAGYIHVSYPTLTSGSRFFHTLLLYLYVFHRVTLRLQMRAADRSHPLPNGFRSVARGVSADGSVVVGYSNTTGNVQDGFIWKSATNKMQDLNQVLAGAPGAASWVVTDAIAVSGDGNVIAAIALNETTSIFESVRIVLGGATLCMPTSCAAQGTTCGSIA